MDCTPSLPRLFYKTTHKTVLTVIIRVAILQNSCCKSTKCVKIGLLERGAFFSSSACNRKTACGRGFSSGLYAVSFFYDGWGREFPASGGTSFLLSGASASVFWGRGDGAVLASRQMGRSPQKGGLQLKLVNGVEHDVTVEGFGATELAGAGTYVAAFGCLLAEQVNGF